MHLAESGEQYRCVKESRLIRMLIARLSTSIRSVSLRSNERNSRRLRRPALSIIGIVLAMVAGGSVRQVYSQGFSIQSGSDPSVVGAGTFVSFEGKFRIALPQNHHGFGPLSIPTPVGPAKGDFFRWTMKEGSFFAGYVDAPQSLDEPETNRKLFAGIRDALQTLVASKNGKLSGDRKIDFEKYPALELKSEFSDRITWQRFYVISHRLYQVMVVLKPEQRDYEAVVVKVLDSFKLLSDSEVAAALKARKAEAEPSPLPQEPVVARVSSDAEDNGFHGRVKTVFEEDEDLSGSWSVQGRKPNSMEYYNERGYLTKREFYDYKGNLNDITVYGYLDNARVSLSKTIEHEYNPPSVMIAAPPGAARPKSDSRYTNKFTFQYDNQKRLVEKIWFMNNGELWLKYVYKYAGNQREELVYSADGSLNQRYSSILDEKGNEIEETSFETRDGSIRNKYKYAYEFDAKHNWVKRTTSKWVAKDGKSDYEAAYVDYRTITYHE